MKLQLKEFEDYIASLTEHGVFPSFQRKSKGWVCILRNGAGKQLMPFNSQEDCWGEIAIDALTVAVEGLNSRFSEPKELHKYIDTGIDQSIERLQTVKTSYAQ
jgi:hypothetical protein